MANLIRSYAMTKVTLLVVVLGLASALVIVAACGGSSDPATAAPTATPGPANTAVGAPGPTAIPPVPSGEIVALRQSTANIQFSPNQQVGIWVTGRGEVTTTPDLVILSAGVEARAPSVQVARTEAASAMDGMVQVLRARGIQDKDIQTRFFNISPEHVFNRQENKQELVGYIVSNQVLVKIRDVAEVGVVIDEVAAAAGDLVRIQGVTFTVEDSKALESEARQKAFQDLTAKAQQYAELAGVQLGNLIFLSESGVPVPRPLIEARAVAVAQAASGPPTAISGGELTVSVSVQGVFSIIE